MSLITSITPCEDVQADLKDFFMNRAPATLIEDMGFLSFLKDPVNTTGLAQQVHDGPGKIKNINLLYDPRLPESEVNENFNIVCSSTRDDGDTFATYTIDPDASGFSVDFRIKESDLRYNCKDNADWLMAKLLKHIAAVDRKIAQAVANQATALVGAFVDTTNVTNDVKTVQTQDASANNLQNLLEEVVYNSENNGYSGSTYMFGWGELKKYMTRVAAACCADSGTNLAEFAQQNPLIFRGDYRIPAASAFTTNNFITTIAGAMQLLEYVEFEGEFNTSNDDSFEQRVIQSPFSGLKMDLFSTRVCGSGGITHSFTIKTAQKLVGMPTDMFLSSDRMDGVTFVNQYVIDNS